MLTVRRKAFVVGLILNAKSVRKLADELLNRPINPYSYVLPYKDSQDHVELLNSCIRGKNGNNNNPDIVQFRSALKKILLRASITASKYANCISFDNDDSPPIFSLKWTKNRSTLSEQRIDAPSEDESFVLDISDDSISEHRENALSYIAGWIVRKLIKLIDCEICCQNLMATDRTKRYLSLISLKDNGGLVYPSDDVVKIVMVCDKYFRRLVLGDDGNGISASKSLRKNLSSAVINELSSTRPGSILFESLLEHDIDTHVPTEDFHSTQIMKAIVSSFLDMRMLRHGQAYTKTVIHAGKLGKRQEMTKLLQFQGL